MSDLVQRLRDGLEAGAIDLADIMDAADEIETEPLPKEKRAEVSDTNHDAVPEAKAMHSRDCSGGLSGTGDSLSEAEIDALECVVEDGRIVGMSVYGVLRSLLVRLRPEWEDDGDSDMSQPISDARLGSLERLSALDQELELSHGMKGNPMIKPQQRTQQEQATQAKCTKQGEGSVPDSRTENEPVAWLVKGVEYDTGCEYEYVTLMKEKAEIAAENGGNVIPLFDGPQTWQEEVAAVENAFERSGVKPTWPDDEPGSIGPMAAAMADEIARLRITDAEREAIAGAIAYEHGRGGWKWAETLRGLLERLA